MKTPIFRFPVAYCDVCVSDVLLARDLDDDDNWVLLCARCGAPPASPPREARDADELSELGFELEGIKEGCSGGCGG